MLEIFTCIKIDAELNETTLVISFNRFHVDFYILKKMIQKYMSYGPPKMIHAHSDRFKQWLSSNIILIHISIMMLLSSCGSASYASSPKTRNTTSEYLVQNLTILEIWLILSEFNQTDIHRSVCQCYIRLIILRMHIKKGHHEKKQ